MNYARHEVNEDKMPGWRDNDGFDHLGHEERHWSKMRFDTSERNAVEDQFKLWPSSTTKNGR